MRKPKLRELKEAVKAVFQGPYTSKFPKVMPEIPEKFRGFAKYNEEGCIGCCACAEVCPAIAIQVTDDPVERVRRLELDYGSCLFCENCVQNCITGEGIKMSQQFDASTYDRRESKEVVEKELVVCEDCGCVVAPVDQIRWVARRVGSVAYSNPTLMLQMLQDMGLVDKAEPPREPGEERPYRSGHIKILCPKCRREIVLHEQWGYE
jgi:hydrogenase-4 component H